MGCNGTIDINRVLAKIGDVTEVESVTGSGATPVTARSTAGSRQAAHSSSNWPV